MSARLFKFIFVPYLRQNVLRLWPGVREDSVLTKDEVQLVLKNTWEIFDIQITKLPKQANPGNWLVMNFAYLTLCAYQALMDLGFSEAIAISLIQELSWHITSTWTRRAKRFSNVFFKDKLNQLEFFVNRIMKMVFSPPGYQYFQGEFRNGFYLDVCQCPVAQLMKTHGASELCIIGWCNLDFGLAEIFCVTLIRSGTIAMGKEKCDFKFV